MNLVMDGTSVGDWIAAVAAISSAIAATFSYFSSRTANTLAKYALTNKTQSELFTTTLLEVADLLRIERAYVLTQSDEEFLAKKQRYVALGKQLQQLNALSTCFEMLVKGDNRASAFLANLADESASRSVEVDQLEAIMSILQQAHRNELNDH